MILKTADDRTAIDQALHALLQPLATSVPVRRKIGYEFATKPVHHLARAVSRVGLINTMVREPEKFSTRPVADLHKWRLLNYPNVGYCGIKTRAWHHFP
jgi:hypothetical protein